MREIAALSALSAWVSFVRRSLNGSLRHVARSCELQLENLWERMQNERTALLQPPVDIIANSNNSSRLVSKSFPNPFSIESLIANQSPTAAPKQDREMDQEHEGGRESDQEIDARAIVASSALGLTQFPLYNPWLHGYFAQNHERLSHLIAGGCYLGAPSYAEKDSQLEVAPPHALDGISLNASKPLPHPLDTRFLPFNAATATTPDLGYRRLAEIMNQDYVHNLSIHSRLQQMASARAHEESQQQALVLAQELDSQPRLSSPLKSHSPSEPAVDVGMDEDYECSGDSCSDISLTMSPQNYNSELDKSRNGGRSLNRLSV